MLQVMNPIDQISLISFWSKIGQWNTCHGLKLSLWLLFIISNILSFELGTSRTWLSKKKIEKKRKLQIKHQNDGLQKKIKNQETEGEKKHKKGGVELCSQKLFRSLR